MTAENVSVSVHIMQKKAITDSIDMINSFKYTVAIPAPSLYGQFKTEYSRNRILNALKYIGFNEVYEVARAAEYVTAATRELMGKKVGPRPLISSACPAVVRLIQVRFPNLIDNLVKLESPMEVAAKISKNRLVKEKGLEPDDIGVFFITPCAAKVTSVKAPYENEKSAVDGVLSIKDLYLKLLSGMDKIKNEELLSQAGFEGIRWANSGGEGLGVGTDRYLAVDGIHNVNTILEAVENDKIEDVEFIEALACTGGCLGGPLTVENVYVAKTRLKKHIDEARENSSKNGIVNKLENDIVWKGSIKHRPVLKLDDDFAKAMKKLEELEVINKELPGLDCGACGAPSCRALAEDIVRGNANETDCIFKLRERVRDLATQMAELEARMPPVLDKSMNAKTGEESGQT